MKNLPKSASLLFIFILMICLNSSCKKDEDPPQPTLTDIDGNVYKAVKIGTQIWMKENLKTTKYRNGDPIPNVTDGMQWLNLTTGAFCHYENNPVSTEIYGLLYNWYAVSDARKICPAGWHVPSKTEWETLVIFVGGETVAGNILKEKGTAHWNGPNSGATDAYGFSALPGGYRIVAFNPAGAFAVWWSATPVDQEDAWIFDLVANNSNSFIEEQWKFAGHAVRCIKD